MLPTLAQMLKVPGSVCVREREALGHSPQKGAGGAPEGGASQRLPDSLPAASPPRLGLLALAWQQTQPWV